MEVRVSDRLKHLIAPDFSSLRQQEKCPKDGAGDEGKSHKKKKHKKSKQEKAELRAALKQSRVEEEMLIKEMRTHIEAAPPDPLSVTIAIDIAVDVPGVTPP
ncbi:hypothetical protein HAX54_004332 [Datura stramonium]|uniref:Uncharacterized protein n=1 Tax=Datura stramonium TaxID=4076 RepID=A0ABS8RHM6_DATST|nr:hypothetical protein [Datura stramonium]